METDGRDIYSAPKAPPPAGSEPRWRRGLLLATLPALIYSVLDRWLIGPSVPDFVAVILWFGVVWLTFDGVGVFVWSSSSRPTWGRIVVAVLVTGVWIRLVISLVGIAAAFLRDLDH